MRGLGALALATGLALTPAAAKELKIGTIRGSLSIDPHFTTSVVVYEANASMFEPLVRRTNDGKMAGWLAESWQIVDDTTWEFKLKPGIKWQDGQPLTSADIAFTYGRAGDVPKSPSSYARYLRSIKEVQVIDDLTFRIITDGPQPTLLNGLTSVLIVSKHVGDGASTEDYFSGKAMVGTGPYKFVSWTPNDTIVVERNPDYWGGTPPWDKVTFIGMPNASTRVAALRSGDIDVALSVPAQDVAALQADPDIDVVGGAPNRMIFMAFNAHPEAVETGMITGPNGETLTENPLANADVRNALKYAIDTKAITDKVFLGLALPTGQLLHDDMFGYIPGYGTWTADVEKARALLEKSGWAGKFKLVLATSDTNFPLAVPTVQAIAQEWTQMGVPTEVQVFQESVFLDKRNHGLLPVYPTGWSNPSGTAEDIEPAVIHTRDTKAGWGATNQANYSNPDVDKLIEDGMVTMDDGKREELFRQAGQIAYDEAGIIPLFSPFEMHAVRKGIVMHPRNDAYTMIYNIEPAQ
jgi:peptide/nickel transport system substrate-binding protein